MFNLERLEDRLAPTDITPLFPLGQPAVIDDPHYQAVLSTINIPFIQNPTGPLLIVQIFWNPIVPNDLGNP